jgi:hypothetical protein
MERAPWAAAPGVVEALAAQLAPHAPESGAAAEPASAGAAPGRHLSRAQLFIPAGTRNAIGCIVVENSYAPEEQRVLSALFPFLAMANHSCAPAAGYTTSWDAKARCPVVRLFAERDLAAGEEVTISYTARSDIAESRAAALKRYGFACACARCSAPADDTVALLCRACATGRVGVDGKCTACGAQLTGEDIADYHQRRTTFILGAPAGPAGRRVPPSLVELARLGPPPAVPVHPADQQRFSALHDRLGELPAMKKPAAAARIMDGVLAMLPHVDRGAVFNAGVAVLAGHTFALAPGRADDAKAQYAEAARLFAAAYGEASPRTAWARALAAKPPAHTGDVERAERKRMAWGDWVAAGLVPPRAAERWRAPVDMGRGDSKAGLRRLMEITSQVQAEYRA